MSRTERLQIIYDTFSLRHRGTPAMSHLAPLPPTFRSRVLRFWEEEVSGQDSAIRDSYRNSLPRAFWSEMRSALLHLYGRDNLRSNLPIFRENDLDQFLRECDTAKFFDFMELTFKLQSSKSFLDDADDFVEAFNGMFRIEDLPYQMTRLSTEEQPDPDPPGIYDLPKYAADAYEDTNATILVITAYPQIIRTDEEITHREAVEPALAALSVPHFKQANKEFLDALRHYRNDEFAECLTECANSMESVLKVICERKNWSPDKGKNTLKPLLEIVVDKTSLEPFFKERLMVIGEVRNSRGKAHGWGSEDKSVPLRIARYAITSAAAAIILLIEEADR